ncbi:MAG TPA: hypothetical protein VGD64_14925 [Acidisarcina sp.]
MFLLDVAVDGAQKLKEASKDVKDISFYSRVALPALAALVPAAIGALFKWIQDHSQSRQRVALTDRMAGLAKMIVEVPDVEVEVPGGGPNGGPPVGTSARAVLTAELVSVTRELAALQVTVGRHAVFSSASSRARAALLLYRPHGFLAWVLHGIFYLSLAVFSIGFTGLLAPPHDSEFWYGILGFAILSVIPLIVHYMAARLHRAYCAKQSAAAPVSAGADHPLGARAVPTP